MSVADFNLIKRPTVLLSFLRFGYCGQEAFAVRYKVIR